MEPSPLTKQQELLVTTVGSLFAQACPGAGKTRAIVARFLKRASEESRKGIGLFSFTNAAIDEVRLRCASSPQFLGAPSFVGTFDSFINRFLTRPLYVRQYGHTPHFVDTWEGFKRASFRLSNMGRMPDIELRWFEFDGLGRATLNEEWIPRQPRNALDAVLAAQRDELEERATEIYRRLVAAGTISCAASRALVAGWLRSADTRQLLGTLLAARFSEVIVDEAQDCGPEELAVLRLLWEHGVTIVMVADLDQSIFEFRRADPEKIRAFASELTSHLNLDGNFRSSPAICALNLSLRTGNRAEQPSGRHQGCAIPIQLLPYSVQAEVLPGVTQLRTTHGLGPLDLIILAHKTADARTCAGVADRPGGKIRGVSAIAAAGYELRSAASDPRTRLRAVNSVEQALVAVLRDESDGDLAVERVCEQQRVDRRWLRQAAVRLAVAIDPTGNSARDFAERVRAHVRRMDWPAGVIPRNDLGSLFKAPSEAAWAGAGGEETSSQAWATIHSVKGREFPGVVIILPQRLHQDGTGRDVLDCWEGNAGAEMRRVLYVGVSRAQRLLILAVHKNHVDRVSRLLEIHKVPYAM